MAAGDLVTLPHHLEWRGMVLGYPLSSMTLTEVTGWLDLPPTRSAMLDRPGRHGAFPGKLRAGARVIEASLELARHDYTALGALRDATMLEEDPQEEDLVIWVGTDEPRYVRARLERRAIPTDQLFSIGHHRVVLQWVASDPRVYSAVELSATVGAPQPGSGGLVFPAVFPLYFGAGRGGSTLVVENAGTVPVWPTLTITGPLTGPQIRHAESGRALLFDPSWEILDGQTVTIDTENRAVTLGASTSRDDRLYTRQWFPLTRGINTISFVSSGAWSVAAGLTVTWRHGHM